MNESSLPVEFARIRTRLSPRRTVVPAGRADPTDSGDAPAVIDTVGRTQPVPVVGSGLSTQPDATPVALHGDALPKAPASGEPPSDVAAPTDAAVQDDPVTPTSIDWPAPSADMVRSAELDNVAEVPPAERDDVRTAASVVAATTLVGTELISGLRGAGRHLIRPSASEGHLRTELTIAARRIDSVVRDHDAFDQGWAIAAMGLIHDAGFALDQRRISDGWQLLRAAQTELLEGLDRRSLLVERANITGRELTDDGSTDIEELRSEVWAMRQTKNRYLAELDRRLVEGGRGLLYRGFTLFGALVLGAIGVLMTTPSSNPDDVLGGIGNYLTIVGLAMTGAAVSYVLFAVELVAIGVDLRSGEPTATRVAAPCVRWRRRSAARGAPAGRGAGPGERECSVGLLLGRPRRLLGALGRPADRPGGELVGGGGPGRVPGRVLNNPGSDHRWRRRRASPWAGKPSWSARANTDGVIRASAPASARAMAVRLRNVSAVIPDDT